MSSSGTTIAQAYVQIMPSFKGIKGKLTEGFGSTVDAEGESSGQRFGSKFASAAKSLIAKAAIGTTVVKTMKSALEEGANLQQSYMGGVETLYGSAADQVRSYAKEAAKAGISMNDYSEQAVSFGAALKQAYGGDTVKAAEAANAAIMDMADNSAKMGTNIQDIQNAYQGFAKQNYTMLDNLKLGYGGTKEEMERLLADAEKISGVHYDISNLGDVYDAIHVIQGELNLTGVAAEEASTTLSGSFGAMKAAAQNLVGSMAIGEDIKPALADLITSTSNFLFGNLIPMIGQFLSQVPGAVVSAMQTITAKIQAIIPQVTEAVKSKISSIGTIASDIAKQFSTAIPEFLQAGVDLLNGIITGIMQGLPSLIAKIPEIVSTVCQTLISSAGILLNGVVQLIQTIATNLPTLITSILEALPTVITTIVNTIVTLVPMLITGLIQVVQAIVAALPQIIQAIIDALPGIITSIVEGIIALAPVLIEGAIQLVAAIVVATPQIIAALIEAIPEIIAAIVEGFAPLGADLGEFFTGVWDDISSTATAAWDNIKDALSDAWDGIKSAASEKFETIKSTISTAWDNVKTNTSTAWDTIQSTIDEHGGGIQGVIGAAVDGFKTTWEAGFSAINELTGGKLGDAASKAEEKLADIKGKFSDKMDAIKEVVSSGLDKVKDFFSNCKLKLPDIKLPHFSISGEFSLKPPSVPHLSVDWYAKAMNNAMVLRSPTIFGVSGGSLLGGGESGAEVVAGESHLLQMISDAVDSTAGMNVTVNVYATPGMDVNELADVTIEKLQKKIKREGAAF